MKKINIGEPLQQYTPWYSSLLAVASKAEGYADWINSHFVNIYFKSEESSGKVLSTIYFIDIPDCLEIKTIPRKVINSVWSEISEFVKFIVDNDYCVYMDVDPYYIKDFSNYKKDHDNNTLLIHGYDNHDSFNIAGFFDYPNNTFSNSICSAESLNRSVSFQNIEDKEIAWYQNVNILKIKSNSIAFSLAVLLNNIKLYLEEDNNKGAEYEASGIGIYQNLIELLENNSSQINSYIFSSIVTHKKIMLSRYHYITSKGLIEKNNGLTARLNNMVELSVKIEKIAEQYLKNPTNKKRESIKENLICLRELEYDALNIFVELIDRKIV